MDTRMNNLNGLLLRDVRWKVKTAGPSPFNNERTELFLLGCNKAMSGNPCKGCFNSTTWDTSRAEFSHDPILMAQHIKEHAPNKYITIGGGEPTDQIKNLIILCKNLKQYDFHIMIYTWKILRHALLLDGPVLDPLNDKENEFCDQMRELLKYVDIVVDGEYKEEERVWDGQKEDGLVSSIGSGNQIVWDIKKQYGFSMRDISKLFIDENNNLQFLLKNQQCKKHSLEY